jgi:hypothetical protein
MQIWISESVSRGNTSLIASGKPLGASTPPHPETSSPSVCSIQNAEHLLATVRVTPSPANRLAFQMLI